MLLYYTIYIYIYIYGCMQSSGFMRQNTPHPRELKARHSKIQDKKAVDGHMIHKDPREAKDVCLAQSY